MKFLPDKIGCANGRYLVLYLLFFSLFTQAQNLYDYQHSCKYAKHLKHTRQYELASEEFERLLFMNPGNDTLKLELIHSYLLNAEYGKVTQRTRELFYSTDSLNGNAAFMYTSALIMDGNFTNARFFLQQNNTLKASEKRFLQLNNYLLSFNWEPAKSAYTELKESGDQIPVSYQKIINDIENLREKSPALAVGMSALVPGTGKIYTGEWKDGLVSLLFVGGSVFQSVRGYKLYGEKSAFFIAYTSLAATFYLSNLYGTLKSARRFNNKQKQNIHKRAEDAFINSF